MGEKRSKTIRAFIVIGFIIGILLIALLVKSIDLFPSFNIILTSVQSLLFGIVFACIMTPMLGGFEKLLTQKLATPEDEKEELIRGLAVLFTVLVTLFIVVSIILLVIPQVGVTVEKIIPSFQTMIDNFNEWVRGFSDSEFWQERVYPMVYEVTSNISGWILQNIGIGTDAFNTITSGLMSLINIFFNMFIGFILSVYLLINKEKLFAQIEKLCMAIFRKKLGPYIMDAIDEAARIFSGFFGAKILEAIIMGVICFVGMMIMQLPYATLISVIVGVANIIPFFGPYIGTILGAALIVLVDPWDALYFIIFMIILVQFDGNLLGPKIIGHSTGLSAMWVVVSILLFGGCFGIVGMFIGVPVFAWLYYIVKRLAEKSLRRQALPVATEDYEEKREAEAAAEAAAAEAAEEAEKAAKAAKKAAKKEAKNKR